MHFMHFIRSRGGAVGGAAGKAPKAATANWKFRCPHRGDATQLSATQCWVSECIEWVSDAFARTRPLATVSCNNSPCNSFGFGFECESRAASGLSQPSFKFNAAQRRCPWRRRRWQRRWRQWRPWELCDKLPSDDACGMRPPSPSPLPVAGGGMYCRRQVGAAPFCVMQRRVRA